MLLPATNSTIPQWTNRTNPRPRPSQQGSSTNSKDDFLFDESNVILAAVGVLLAFFTLLIAILQWKQFRRSNQSSESIGPDPKSESSVEMGAFGAFLPFNLFDAIHGC